MRYCHLSRKYITQGPLPEFDCSSSQYKVPGNHRPTSETSLKWRFAGWPMVVRSLAFTGLHVVLCILKEFIVRLRTVSVDVDSRGQSCKEKMMTIVAEEPSSSPERG